MTSPEIQKLYPQIRAYFKSQPIEKAWIFGSCSRGENRLGSDLDILVRYTQGTKLSLFGISKIMTGLSRIVGMKVDLVEEGRVLPFAVDNVNRDKIIIYERANADDHFRDLTKMIAGMRYKNVDSMSRTQETDGISRCFAQTENNKRQSL